MDRLKELKWMFETLTRARDLVRALHPLKSAISSDTAFAFGQALGAIDKAKTLVGRDIDDCRREGKG